MLFWAAIVRKHRGGREGGLWVQGSDLARYLFSERTPDGKHLIHITLNASSFDCAGLFSTSNPESLHEQEDSVWLGIKKSVRFDLEVRNV